MSTDDGDAVDLVNHPPHYRGHPSGIECIRITRLMTFDAGNAVKYVYRAAAKNGRQDLDKARWYLEDAMRSNDPIFQPGKVDECAALLRELAAFEPNPIRASFFDRVARSYLDGALRDVHLMLAEPAV